MKTAAIGLALAGLGAVAAPANHHPPQKPDCTCRAPGARYELGQTACLLGRVHICEMVQNVTNWRPTGAACPEASIQPKRPRFLSLLLQRRGWPGEAGSGGDRDG